MSTTVLLDALRARFDVCLLSHELSLTPSWNEDRVGDHRWIQLGVQPLTPHIEAFLAGALYERRLARWSRAWAVNSRYAGALALARVPFVIWEATTISDELRVVSPSEVRRAGVGTGVGALLHRSILPVARGVEGWVYRRAQRIFAMSEYTRGLIVDTHAVPPERVGVLLHPPSREYLASLAKAEGSVERRGDRVLYVGRADDPRKGFDVLLDAWRLVLTRRPSATLTVIGPHAELWRSRLGELGDAIQFAGRVSLDELASAYLSHDLLVLPSRQEGFGIVVAEALHAGLPVVSTRCGGPEQMIRESEGGTLVEHEPAALSSAIGDLLDADDARLAIGMKGRRYARKVLGPDEFMARVVDITNTMQTTGPARRAA